MNTNVDTPVEAADFYLGRGEDATYLGSTDDGHPAEVDVWDTLQHGDETEEFTDAIYLERVAALVDSRVWPHSHVTSIETPWAYCYDKGTTYVYRYGREMAQIRANFGSWRPKVERLDDGREVTNRAVRQFARRTVSLRWRRHHPKVSAR